MGSIRSAVTLLLVLTLSLATSATAQPLSGPEFIPLFPPCRALDTRVTGTPVPANVHTVIQISGVTTGGTDCGVPSRAVAAAALNFTITQPQGPGHLTAWAGGSLPLASVVNFVAGETVANAVDIGLGQGAVVVVSAATTHLVVDIYGYFTDVEQVGRDSTALGVDALASKTSGTGLTAMGFGALFSNTTGAFNTATGFRALVSNTTGDGNTAMGAGALVSNTTGAFNTATGAGALGDNTTGDSNTAIGVGAGSSVTTGSNNIHIGNEGTAADSRIIRIGLAVSPFPPLPTHHLATFIAGIRDVTTGVNDALTVLIDSTGQLGTTSSSRRVKTDTHDLGDQSRALHQLRPVSFRYRSHPPDGPLEYGLIAEEVAEIYPELVVRDTDGQPSGVRYHVLPAMLLNEVQRQARELAEQARELRELRAKVQEIDELRAQVRALVGGKAANVK